MASQIDVSPVLVGRDEELRRLVSTVVRSPSVAVVEGEAGIGKTRLITELGKRPEVAGRRFVIGRCGRIREPFPMGPIIEALRGTAGDLEDVPLSVVAGTLRPLLPELAGVLPVAPEPLDDRAGERHRVFRGLAEILGALAPVVLVLEDLHWADEQTVEFLGYLLAAPPAGLCVVTTLRGEEAGPWTRAVTARVPGLAAHAHVRLAPLDMEQTRKMTAAILDTDHISDEFAMYLRQRTTGLPLAIQELVALLRARGTLIRTGDRWARRIIDALDVPVGLRDSILERVGRLSPNARAVSEAGAVLHVRVPVPVLVAACRAAPLGALDGLDEVLRAGLLSEEAGTVAFRHVLAAQAVYESLSLPRRQDLHGRAAWAVRMLEPVPLGQVAHHLRHAGRLEEWVPAAEKAADQAADLGDDTQAARLLEDVLRNAPVEGALRERLAVKLGWALTHALNPPEAIDLLADVLERDPPRSVRGQLRFLIALQQERTAVLPDLGRRDFAEAVRDLDDRPDLGAWAMVALGVPRTRDVPLSEHVKWLDRALEKVPTINDPSLRVFVLGKVAMVFAVIGDRRWSELADRIQEETGGAPRHRREVNACYSIAQAACLAGHQARAGRLLASAVQGTGRDGAGEMEIRCRAGQALIAYCQGSWTGLAGKLPLLLDALRDFPHDRLSVEAVSACLTLAYGDLDTESRLRAVIRRATATGAFDLLRLPVYSLLRLAATRNQPDAALAETATAERAWEAKELWPVAVATLPALVQAMVSAARFDAAGDLIGKHELGLRGLDAPLGPAALNHAHGILSSATHRWADAVDQLVSAADLYGRIRCVYEAAQAHEQAAEAMFAAGDARAPRILLAAVASYERLGARWDLDRAGRLARREGVSLPARHRGGARGYGSALSPREETVAELAATGLTNKQIAQELFLATKTVDKHLSAALRKLGLRSRTALARRMGTSIE